VSALLSFVTLRTWALQLDFKGVLLSAALTGPSNACILVFCRPEHFPAKWTPVRRRKCDQTKKTSIFRRSGHRFVAENATKPKRQAFSDEVDTGSSQKMRPNKKLEHFPTKWTPVRREEHAQNKRK